MKCGVMWFLDIDGNGGEGIMHALHNRQQHAPANRSWNLFDVAAPPAVRAGASDAETMAAIEAALGCVERASVSVLAAAA